MCLVCECVGDPHLTRANADVRIQRYGSAVVVRCVTTFKHPRYLAIIYDVQERKPQVEEKCLVRFALVRFGFGICIQLIKFISRSSTYYWWSL